MLQKTEDLLYGFGPKAEGKGLIACVVQCDRGLKQEWMDYCRLYKTTPTSLYFIVSPEQYLTTLKLITNHVRDFTGATHYGIISYSDDVMTCRGFVREVLASMNIYAPPPGISLTNAYLSSIDRKIRHDIAANLLSAGILEQPVPQAIIK